jgi:methylated-DNA-[protein]-cysteine S-methyltransferase
MLQLTFGGHLQTFSGTLKSDLGLLEVKADETGLKSIYFVEGDLPENRNGLVEQAIAQLLEYFAGKRQVFDVSLNPKGTAFQKRVWSELLNIPYGETTSYLAIAKKLGDAKAVRAVGLANGRNPLSIVVPCHRVIGSDGSLTGYAGGIWRKEKLLKLESRQEELF